MDGDFAVGARVNARGLTWDIVEVVPLGSQTMLRLRCAGGDLDGLEWSFLHPAEHVAAVETAFRPEAPGPLATWHLYHQACLLQQIRRPGDMTLVQPGRIRLEPYQLVPLMRALELPRPRLLLADGVGLGKTVEAGLIASELIARGRAHRVLVIAPAGPLLQQWAQELRERFGLRFTVISDGGALQEHRRRLELGGNPFDAMALCLTSLDFAKQERVLEELERSAWDLAIIDEAHHCIGKVASTDREDTQRRRLAEVVARRSDGLLLLTATPHDGYNPHFASLIELLDPSLVDGSGGVVGTAYRRHVVRRLKSHLHDPATGKPLFRDRRVIPVKVDVSNGAVRHFHEALATLIAPRLQRAKMREHPDALAFIGLLKRSVSTIAACVNTLRVVAERYAQTEIDTAERERTRSLRAYRKRLLRFGVLDEAAENDLAELERDGMAADLRSSAADDLVALMRTDVTGAALAALIGLGEVAAATDPKLAVALQEVCAIRRQQPAANVLIYTEYADSQSALSEMLGRAIDGEVLTINGTQQEQERSAMADRFSERDGVILISTDSLAEGLNLHQRCCNLLHLDLPYNPNRLEQRNGRIDRYGQQHEPQIRYLYLAGTFEERLLLHLIAKYEKARAHLTFMPETLGVTADAEAWTTGLIAGFAERQAGLFDDQPSAIQTLDRVAQDNDAVAYRDLLYEIDRAFAGFDRSAVQHGWLDDHGRDADVSVPGNSHIDLPDFVSAAITLDNADNAISGNRISLPADWLAGLDGLPGFDRSRRELRLTRDHATLRDEWGCSLAFLGRVHPLVRRAISRVQLFSDPSQDVRVSIAAPDNTPIPSVLLTYSVELRSSTRVEFRQLVAILLPMHGKAREISDAPSWLRLGSAEYALSVEHCWHSSFAKWLPRRLPEAEELASQAMQRLTTAFVSEHQVHTRQQEENLQRWLHVRARDLCGLFVPTTGDLFGADHGGAEWQRLSDPLDRLAIYATDPDNHALRRHEANEVVELFRRRGQDLTARTALSAPTLRPVGMLMLVTQAAGK